MEQDKEQDCYLIKRISITPNMDQAHLLEVTGLCPLCGKNLLASKGNRRSKLYEIAHIYPNSPLESQTQELEGVERLGDNCEDFKNKIALCKDCHGLYDDRVTKAEYLNLLDMKKNLMKLNNARIETSHQDIEDEIGLVIDELCNIDINELKEIQLRNKAVEIKQKIEDDYLLLKKKVENNICIYFYYIKERFQTLEENDKLSFNIIASEIHTSFLMCEKQVDNKSQIFNSLVSWLQSKTKSHSVEACEAIISYFIQDCEVFNEIT